MRINSWIQEEFLQDLKEKHFDYGLPLRVPRGNFLG